MPEIELKLQVPAQSLPAMLARLKALGARSARLRTAYFDTPDRALARSGLAWRIRREGRQWVQTLKAGDGLIREEHEVTVPGVATVWPTPEPGRHVGTTSGTQLLKILNAADAPVAEQFRTDFTRLSAPLRSRRGWVELSLDRGTVEAGEASVPLCELEIELIKGSPRAVTEVAALLIRRYGLWIDMRSKAQRGHMLAAGVSRTAARGAEDCRLSPTMTMPVAWQSTARCCSPQILLNASQIASDEGADADHVHQLRVGLRRLRAAIRLFGSVIPDAEQFGSKAGELARAFGANRDRDVMASSLWPELERAGAPLAALPIAASEVSPTQILRATDHQRWLIRLIESCEAHPGIEAHQANAGGGSEAADAEDDLETTLTRSLDRGYRSIRRKLKRFDELTEEERHRLRRQLKRLRYGIEFCSALLPARKTRRLLRLLAKAQDVLGDYNDAITALAAYRTHAESDPRAWFGVGWLSHRLPGMLSDCRAALEKLASVPPPWGKRARKSSHAEDTDLNPA